MLIGNASVYNRVPGRVFGGVTLTAGVETTFRASFRGSGAIRNRMLQDGLTTAAKLIGLPLGQYQPVSWSLPQVGGYINSAYAFSGSGNISPLTMYQGVAAVASLIGSGDATKALLQNALIAALSSGGNITTAVLDGPNVLLTANLSGGGNIVNALATSAAFISAGLSGQGDISSAAGSNPIVALAAAISGVGTTSAPLQALGWVSAGLTGAAVGTPTLTATGALSGSIKSYSDLTSQGAADAVWGQLLDSGYSAQQIVELLASALAGKVSGAGSGTITFRDLGDTKDRIVATVDASGNRTVVTKNVS